MAGSGVGWGSKNPWYRPPAIPLATGRKANGLREGSQQASPSSSRRKRRHTRYGEEFRDVGQGKLGCQGADVCGKTCRRAPGGRGYGPVGRRPGHVSSEHNVRPFYNRTTTKTSTYTTVYCKLGVGSMHVLGWERRGGSWNAGRLEENPPLVMQLEAQLHVVRWEWRSVGYKKN